MADGNFMTNPKILGNCVHEIKILLFAKIRRMARIVKERNDRIVFPPRSSSRPGFILCLTFLKTNY